MGHGKAIINNILGATTLGELSDVDIIVAPLMILNFYFMILEILNGKTVQDKLQMVELFFIGMVVIGFHWHPALQVRF